MNPDPAEEFRLCNKYGFIRAYKMETDYVITAKQVELFLVKMEVEKLRILQAIKEAIHATETAEDRLKALIYKETFNIWL